jgi:hypothetical protein
MVETMYYLDKPTKVLLVISFHKASQYVPITEVRAINNTEINWVNQTYFLHYQMSSLAF